MMLYFNTNFIDFMEPVIFLDKRENWQYIISSMKIKAMLSGVMRLPDRKNTKSFWNRT